MTDAPSARPDRSKISSTPLLRASLVWGLTGGLAVLVIAATIGWFVGEGAGLASGALGAVVGIVFPALTAVSILVANRWYGSPAYLQIFFGVVMGGWILKFVVVIVALIVISRLPWILPLVFYFALVAAALVAVVVDLVVILRMRLPAVSDVRLPGDESSS